MQKILSIFVLFIVIITSSAAQNKKELYKTIQSQKSEIISIKSELNDLKRKYSNVSDNINSRTRRVYELEIENENLKNDLTIKEDNLLKLKNNLATKEKDLSKLKNKLETIGAEKQNSKIYQKEELKRDTEKDLSIEKDDFKRKTFYEDKRGNKYHLDLNDILAPNLKLNLYFSIPYDSDKAEALRFIIGFKHDNWLFTKKVTFLIDGNKYDITGEFKRDAGSGNVYEWIDKSATGTTLSIIKAIMNSNSTKIRFTGKQYNADVIVKQEQKDALKNIYNLYKSKGGN